MTGSELLFVVGCEAHPIMKIATNVALHPFINPSSQTFAPA